MKRSGIRELPDVAREVLNFARNDQGFAVQAALLCASSTKACGQGFFACARSSKPCRDISRRRRARKKLRRGGPVADASEQKSCAKSVKPCRSSKGPGSYSSSAHSRASELGERGATARRCRKVRRRWRAQDRRAQSSQEKPHRVTANGQVFPFARGSCASGLGQARGKTCPPAWSAISPRASGAPRSGWPAAIGSIEHWCPESGLAG